MKGRESGMPDADYWQTFFDAPRVLRLLDVVPLGTESVVEFGSGYGTFSLPLARMTTGKVHALDIENPLVDLLQKEANRQGLSNLEISERDFVADGSGLPVASVDHAMLFNILHIEEPVALLREAIRVLRPGGMASVIHWRRDIATPRGPSLDIRPLPEQCLAWAKEAGFAHGEAKNITPAAPWHFGLLLYR